MAKERSFLLYLLAIASVHYSQTIAYNRSTVNTTDNVTDVKSQCLSSCGFQTKYDKSHFSSAPQNDEDINCYRKCIASAAEKSQQSTKRKNRSAMVTSTNTKYECPPGIEPVERKLGDIEDLSVAFVQHRGEDGNLTWIANVTWDAIFSNDSKYLIHKWKGFLVTWSKQRNAPVSFEIYCRFISKNTTSFIIESNSTEWVYPGVIQVGVSFYPPTKEEYIYGIDLVSFDPKDTEETSTTNQNPPSGQPVLHTILSISLGCFAGVVIVGAVAYVTWKKRSHRTTRVPDEENFEYDLSVFYSTRDEKWVTEELIPLLETQNNFKYYIHYRDFEVGRVLHENIANAVYKCRKNLAVVSNNFFNSNYCKEELHMSLERMQRLGNNSLIVVNLDGVSEDKLPKALLRRTFVNLTNPLEQKTWRNRLIRQISVEDENAPTLNGNQERSFVRLQKGNKIAVVQNLQTNRNESDV